VRENLESLELSKNRVEMIEYAAKLPVFLKTRVPRHKTNCQNLDKNRLRFTNN